MEIWRNAANIYLGPLLKLQKKIMQVITFSKYLLQVFKNNLGYIPKAVESLFLTNSDIHKYWPITRIRDKMRSAYCKHEFMCSNFRFVVKHIWNYILDHLDVNVTLPKFNKKHLKHIFWLVILDIILSSQLSRFSYLSISCCFYTIYL